MAQLRSRRINVMQGVLTYYLYASKVPKRVITILNRFGITVSYQSLQLALESIASSQLAALKEVCSKNLAIQVSIDNLTIPANVRDERLHNKSNFLNYTAGYVVEPPQSRAMPMFSINDVNYH